MFDSHVIETKPTTVSELNKNAKNVLEQNFTSVFVTGEVSNCMRPTSGHYYFSLKDDKAQISCALFKAYQGTLTAALKNGSQVNLRGKLSIYEGRGNYQLLVTALELVGNGSLQQQFEQLKLKLQAEGIFATEIKKVIPARAKNIGVITSATGAAICDILKVLKLRYPIANVILYPTQVQGDAAKTQIVAAVNAAERRQECDVLIISRGGGSIEDLWPFNEEIVARAIANCSIPTITGIGHEVDITIADFVADLRAATPSQAAQFASPDKNDLLKYLAMLASSNSNAMSQAIKIKQLRLGSLAKQLQHPTDKLNNWAQMLDNDSLMLEKSLKHVVYRKKSELANLVAKLEALSPLKTLSRGYVIADCEGKIITTISDINCNDQLNIRLVDGTIAAKVTAINHLKEGSNE